MNISNAYNNITRLSKRIRVNILDYGSVIDVGAATLILWEQESLDRGWSVDLDKRHSNKL